MSAEPKTITVEEAAGVLGLTEHHVRAIIREQLHPLGNRDDRGRYSIDEAKLDRLAAKVAGTLNDQEIAEAATEVLREGWPDRPAVQSSTIVERMKDPRHQLSDGAFGLGKRWHVSERVARRFLLDLAAGRERIGAPRGRAVRESVADIAEAIPPLRDVSRSDRVDEQATCSSCQYFRVIGGNGFCFVSPRLDDAKSPILGRGVRADHHSPECGFYNVGRRLASLVDRLSN